MENRILWLDTEVDNWFLEFGKYIIMWNMEDHGKPLNERKPIRLLFFSPGGSIEINNAMIDIIRTSKTKIIGINMGMAHSAGCFIYLACHERYAMPNSVFLLHQGSGMFGGTYNEIVSQVAEYVREIDNLKSHITNNTSINEKTVDKNISTEWYVTATEALEYGICHKIIDDLDMLFE